MFWLGIVGYGGAALAYGVTTIIVVVGKPRNARAASLAAAIAMSCVWAGVMALSLLNNRATPTAVLLFDVLHLLLWTWCVLCWFGSPIARWWLLAASAAAGVVAIVATSASGALAPFAWTNFPALVLMALIALIATEQVYRNAGTETRQQLTLLCVAVGGVVAFDLFVFAHAALLGGIDLLFWLLRGFASLAVLPLLLLTTRHTGWERAPFVSPQVVFYTASLLGVGTYLLAMGVVAYVMKAFELDWGIPLDLVFLAAGVGVLVGVLFSADIRRRVKVFLLKHFYRTKYDYRQAWLRLTESLARTGDLQQTASNALEGMGRIIGSERGHLWAERDGSRYEWLVSLANEQPPQPFFERDHRLVAFLRSTGWVIDSEEYAEAPDRYGNAFGHPDEALLPPDSLTVPLQLRADLLGFVILGKPVGLRSLNFEDHDILKTAGRQVAAVLAQSLVQEQLAETRQFEALNRLSAFLMHDLKNIVAEQELVLANAQRFRHRADFIEDAFNTIRGGTERIKKVLARLTTASRTRPPASRVEVSKLLMEVRSQCADRQPVPQFDPNAQAAWVRIDRDELASVLLHLVRNAQDATPAAGKIELGLSRNQSEILITVSDTGSGMDSTFIRDSLFRPFQSTKGEAGMGIGAYQARHIVRHAGGELDVSSQVGVGTSFVVRLPVAA